jgi:hypothetical protein
VTAGVTKRHFARIAVPDHSAHGTEPISARITKFHVLASVAVGNSTLVTTHHIAARHTEVALAHIAAEQIEIAIVTIPNRANIAAEDHVAGRMATSKAA